MSADKVLRELRQGNKDLIAYLSYFNRLVVETAWPEEKRSAVFHQGLKDKLKDVLAQVELQPEACTDLINLTLRLDHRLSERKGVRKKWEKPNCRMERSRHLQLSSDPIIEPMDIGTVRPSLTKEEKDML
ncbi:hypothetical protein NDU88_001450 [Pleurodeles waltl]|uniref:Retrotransposon gag domain-containing protein n=1 Tax=Pleurodeles waltl TaxID=8319 RepID=A0AAV7VZH1_PLEWA|nr:hypothetical protein NDU88_001450 [Pleurodeles waltl]